MGSFMHNSPSREHLVLLAKADTARRGHNMNSFLGSQGHTQHNNTLIWLLVCWDLAPGLPVCEVW